MSKNTFTTNIVTEEVSPVSGSELFAGLSNSRKVMLERIKHSPALKEFYLDAYKHVLALRFGNC